MSRRTTLALLLCLLAPLLVGLRPADAAPAATLTMPSTAVAGTPVTVAGRVANAPRGSKVRIQRLSGKTWVTRKTVLTARGGAYSAPMTLQSPGRATFRAYVNAGDSILVSAKVHVAILRHETVRIAADRVEGERTKPLTVTVATTPAQSGGPVTLQTRTTGTWTTIATGALTNAGRATFHPVPTTTGQVQYRVLKPRHGYDAPATSNTIALTVAELRTTFGQLMAPESSHVLDPAVATWSFQTQQPWGADNTEIRWDTPGAFTPSLTPEAVGTVESARQGHDVRDASLGAEFNNGNSSLQNADVSFDATGTSFAIRYLTYDTGSAMVWIDGHPVSASPIVGVAPSNAGQLNWIRVDLAQPGTVHVRFAGPDNFIGVDHDKNDPLTVAASPAPFTLGVVSDSYFDSSLPFRTYEGSGAAVLHTKTGFRIWDLAQGGTGYTNDGTGDAHSGNAGVPGFYASPFGSDARMARLADAPIDALLVNGSINDAEASPTAYAAAVNQFLDRVAQVRPGLPVVVVGIEPVKIPFQTHQANLTAENDLLRSIAARHSNVVGFIDPYGEQWLTGTGNTLYPKGDGNQDQYIRGEDGTHLTPAGHDYYEGRITARLAPLPSTLLP